MFNQKKDMKKINIGRIVFAVIGLIIIGTIAMFLTVLHMTSYKKDNKIIEVNEVIIQHEQIDFMFSETPDSASLIQALEYYDVLFPTTVHAQAILESGYFNSNVCKNYNNLFGLYNSRINDYYKFDHWWESVEAYKKYVQYKYDEDKYEDYYDFLIKLPYAEDTTYISKVKFLENKYNE